MRIVVCLLAMIGCCGSGEAPAQGADAPLSVSAVENAKDRVRIEGDARRAVVDVASATGIGRATLKRQGDTWPERIEITFQLKGLESLTLTHGSTQLRTRLDGDPEFWERDAKGNWTPAKLRAEIRPKLTKVGERTISLEIPPAWLDTKTKELTVDWIDFYR